MARLTEKERAALKENVRSGAYLQKKNVLSEGPSAPLQMKNVLGGGSSPTPGQGFQVDPSTVQTGGVSTSAGARAMANQRLEQGGPSQIPAQPSTNPFTGVQTDPRLIPVGGFSSGTTSTNANEQLGMRLRETPGIGKVFRGLDVLQEKTEPFANVAQQFYTPGAGANAILAAERGLVSFLGRGAAPTVAKRVLGTGAVGAYTGAGQTLAADPGASLKDVGIGAGLGGAFGAAAPLVGAGFRRGAQYARDTAEEVVGRSLGQANQIVRRGKLEVPKQVIAEQPIQPPAQTPSAEVPAKTTKPKKTATSQKLSGTLTTKSGNQIDASVVNAVQAALDKGVPNIQAEVKRGYTDIQKALEYIRENPRTATPKETTPGIRSNPITQRQSGAFSDDLVNLIDPKQEYDIARNVDTVEKANQAVRNLSKAESDFLARQSAAPEDIATGYRIMQELDALGEYQRAVTVSEKLAKDLTKAGQQVQAASIINRLSPDGQLLALTRKAEANNMKVTPEDREAFRNAAIEVKDAEATTIRSNKVEDILDAIEAGQEPSADDLKTLKNYFERARKVAGVDKKAQTLTQEIKQRKRDRVSEALGKQAEAARKRIEARNAVGFLPKGGNDIVDYAIIMADDLAKKAVSAADYVEYVVRNFGEEARPLATDIFNRARALRNDVSRRLTNAEDVVEQYIKKSGKVSDKDIQNIRGLAQSIDKLKGKSKADAEIELQKIMNKYEKSSVNDKLNALRYMAMLGNTATQLLNTTSGFVQAGFEFVPNLIGAMLESVLAPILKRERTTQVFGTDPLKFVADYFKNAKIGAKAGWHGAEPGGIQSASEVRGLAFKGKYNPLGIAERTLQAVQKGADYGVYKTTFDSEIRKQANLAAKRAKKSGDKKFIRDYIANPPDSAVELADRQGRNVTFQRQDTIGGKAADWVNRADPRLKFALKAVLPFIRTPLNIAETAVNLTPAGILRGAWQLSRATTPAEQRDAIRNLGLGVSGVGLGALGYYLSKIGVITGSNESGDRDIDALNEQIGQGKYRFNTSGFLRYISAMLAGEGSSAAEKAAQYQEGDKTLDYNKLQPLAFPVAAGGALERSKDKGAASQASEVGGEALGGLYSLSSLQGLSNVLQTQLGSTGAEKGQGLLTNIAESYLKSFSPSLLAQEARRQDPIQRKTSYAQGIIPDVKDYYQSRIPGLSQQLPPSLTTLGDEKRQPEGVVGTYLNPYRSQVQTYNEAAKFISDLIDRTGVKTLAPTAPQKKISGRDKATREEKEIELTPKEYAEYQQDIGQEVTQKILALKNRTGLTDTQLVKQVENIYEDTKKKYTNRIRVDKGMYIKK